MYKAEILADSCSPAGCRLTTFVVTFPRFILAEVNTHRMLSRNSASSRAIPIEARIREVESNPFIPAVFGKNQRGMQAGENLDADSQDAAREAWLAGMGAALEAARKMAAIGAHKQWANRLLEPYLWHTAILSATDWSNFFNQRIHKDAQPEFRELAMRMKLAWLKSVPESLRVGEWHKPFTQPEDASLHPDQQLKVCIGRCARVSYLTHDGRRDPSDDEKLYNRLYMAGHMSPFEHVAMATDGAAYDGNFAGFKQYRKLIDREADFLG